MKPSILLVAQELYPTTKGGAGMVTANQLKELSSKFQVSLLLTDHDAKDIQLENKSLINNITIYNYNQLKEKTKALDKLSNFRFFHQYKSFEIYTILKQIFQKNTPDIVEFYDFFGPAYFTINAKKTGNIDKNLKILVRNHNTLKDISDYEKLYEENEEISSLYYQEIFCLKNADYILFQSKFLAQKLVKKYGLSHEQTIVSYPPTNILDNLEATYTNPDNHNILFLGRLQPFKGVRELCQAFKIINKQIPDSKLFLIGSDSKATIGFDNVSDEVKTLLGDSLKNVEFLYHLSQDQISQLSLRVKLAIIPSRFESFCYAAHELKKRKIPLLINDIPTFQDFFINNENCIKYDGSINDLANKTIDLLSDNNKLLKISLSPDIEYSDFCTPYMKLSSTNTNFIPAKTVISQKEIFPTFYSNLLYEIKSNNFFIYINQSNYPNNRYKIFTNLVDNSSINNFQEDASFSINQLHTKIFSIKSIESKKALFEIAKELYLHKQTPSKKQSNVIDNNNILKTKVTTQKNKIGKITTFLKENFHYVFHLKINDFINQNTQLFKHYLAKIK